jgi:hypothetical protein
VISQPAGLVFARRLPWLFTYYCRIIVRFGVHGKYIVGTMADSRMGNRFVVQEHTTPQGVHWDLMIEKGDALMTFRLAESPENATNHGVEATRIADHPLRFLTYEGPVQKGTGHVRIVDRGDYTLLDEQGGTISIEFRGTILQGGFTLTRIEEPLWRLVAPRRP